MKKYIAAFMAAFIYFSCIGMLFTGALGQDEILPVNAPTAQTKAIHIMTADERSEILIYDIWQPPELKRINTASGEIMDSWDSDVAPQEPYGWQAFVGQDAISDLAGSNVAYAYGRV